MASGNAVGATGVVAILAIFLVAVTLLLFVFFRWEGSPFRGGGMMPDTIDVDITPSVVPDRGG
jgi:hypothetical protein